MPDYNRRSDINSLTFPYKKLEKSKLNTKQEKGKKQIKAEINAIQKSNTENQQNQADIYENMKTIDKSSENQEKLRKT